MGAPEGEKERQDRAGGGLGALLAQLVGCRRLRVAVWMRCGRGKASWDLVAALTALRQNAACALPPPKHRPFSLNHPFLAKRLFTAGLKVRAW